jgi:hypothetical protein
MSCLNYNKLPAACEKRVMRDHSLVKTKKTIALEDRSGELKLYIGKIESKKYRIIAGSDISPMLIFSLFIVLVES